MSSSIVCSLSGCPVIQGVINKKTGHIYQKSTILCHLRSHKTCPHTSATMQESDIIPIITGNSAPFLTSPLSVSEMLQKLGNEYDALLLQAYSNKQELQKVREELAVSLYHQDAALRVIAKLKSEINDKREQMVKLMQTLRLNSLNTN